MASKEDEEAMEHEMQANSDDASEEQDMDSNESDSSSDEEVDEKEIKELLDVVGAKILKKLIMKRFTNDLKSVTVSVTANKADTID